jgi:hypothetical protein
VAASGDGFHLWIARDADKVVVSTCPLRVSAKAQRHEWGNITDISAGAASTQDAGNRQSSRALLILGIAALAGCLLRIPWQVLLPVTAVIGGVIVLSQVTAERVGVVVAPDLDHYPDIHRVLTTVEERADFLELVRLTVRVGRTLPALKGLVEPTQASQLLALGLWDGAKMLARRQDIRAVLHDLKRHEHDDLPPLSRSRHDLNNQRQRAAALWNEVNAELDRLREHLMAAAVAGETFIRDRDLDRTLERTEKALAELAANDGPGESTAAEQLADETTAVLSAYRDLAELYGGDS